VLWDYGLMIRFPAGCSSMIPSALVTHSNAPIQEGKERYSLVQYSAGGLFHWVTNGFKSDHSWLSSATEEDLEQREEERNARCTTAVKKFSLWKDVKVSNYSGRVRVEVWDSGDLADFSNLTEDDSEEESPLLKKPTARGYLPLPISLLCQYLYFANKSCELPVYGPSMGARASPRRPLKINEVGVLVKAQSC
jgi:hypothetical protein